MAVPVFKNESLEKGIEDLLTTTLIAALQENRQLQITDERRADSVILGTIIQYRNIPYTYDADENVEEYKVEIFVHVEYEDRIKRKALWEEKRMLGWAIYSVVDTPGSVASNEPEAQILAVARLTEDIKTRTVEGW